MATGTWEGRVAVGTTAPTARWLPRVVAALLDEALLLGAAFLLSPAIPVQRPESLPGSITIDPAYGPAVVGAIAVLVLMQAYLGSTPGKLVMGLAVVREADGRPVGLLRTVGRWLCHVVDVVLLVGYLRPLWHPKGRTFADSIAGTLVLDTRAPLPHRALDRDPGAVGPPHVWTAPAEPRWRRHATYAAAAACTVGFLYGCAGSGTVTSAQFVATCGDAAPSGLLGTVQVEHRPREDTVRHLGIERRQARDDAGLTLVWSPTHDPTDDAVVRLALLPTDGGASTTVEAPASDGELDVHADVVDGLGPRWSWQVTLVGADGVELDSCGGDGPRAPGSP